MGEAAFFAAVFFGAVFFAAVFLGAAAFAAAGFFAAGAAFFDAITVEKQHSVSELRKVKNGMIQCDMLENLK